MNEYSAIMTQIPVTGLFLPHQIWWTPISLMSHVNVQCIYRNCYSNRLKWKAKGILHLQLVRLNLRLLSVVNIIWDFFWVSRLLYIFPLNYCKISSLHFRTHPAYMSPYLQLSMSQEWHSAALHHFPSFLVPGKLTVSLMSCCLASAGSSVTRLTPSIPLNSEETHKKYRSFHMNANSECKTTVQHT